MTFAAQWLPYHRPVVFDPAQGQGASRFSSLFAQCTSSAPPGCDSAPTWPHWWPPQVRSLRRCCQVHSIGATRARVETSGTDPTRSFQHEPVIEPRSNHGIRPYRSWRQRQGHCAVVLPGTRFCGERELSRIRGQRDAHPGRCTHQPDLQRCACAQGPQRVAGCTDKTARHDLRHSLSTTCRRASCGRRGRGSSSPRGHITSAPGASRCSSAIRTERP